MKRSLAITAAFAAWILLGFLIGYQTIQENTPNLWSLVQRYALAAFALVITLLASRKDHTLK